MANPRIEEEAMTKVSILTRPYGRMLSSSHVGRIVRGEVSILTRPYGRMLWRLIPGLRRRDEFQSSPALTGGCYGFGRGNRAIKICFNPHPPLRADAIVDYVRIVHADRQFQSSPALTGGCYAVPRPTTPRHAMFQSSPALTGGCYASGGFASMSSPSRFNPHPPLRADAIVKPSFR